MDVNRATPKLATRHQASAVSGIARVGNNPLLCGAAGRGRRGLQLDQADSQTSDRSRKQPKHHQHWNALQNAFLHFRHDTTLPLQLVYPTILALALPRSAQIKAPQQLEASRDPGKAPNRKKGM